MRGEAVTPPPKDTALGGLMTHVGRPQPKYMPSNITWACLPPHENRRLKKRDRYQALSERAIVSIERWLSTAPLLRGPAIVQGVA